MTHDKLAEIKAENSEAFEQCVRLNSPVPNSVLRVECLLPYVETLTKERDTQAAFAKFLKAQMWKVCGHVSRHADEWFDDILSEIDAYERRLKP